MSMSTGATINHIGCRYHGLGRLLPVALLITLTACDHRMISIQAPPDAVMTVRLPVNLSVHFEDSLTGTVYQDDKQPRGLRKITVGDAQTNMFERVLGALFINLQSVPDATSLPIGTDVLVTISLKDFQFSTPKQSYNSSCEVWMKYELVFYTPAGELISDMKLSAYGSAAVSGGKTYPYYVRLALNRAIRDVGARLIVELPKDPKIIHIVKTLSTGGNDS